jgi:hypothetical protein
MSAGAMTDRLALQHLAAPSSPGDETGFTEAPLAAYTTEWAEVVPATARNVERLVGQQVQAPVTHVARLYARSDVRVTDVGTWTDRMGATHQVHVTGIQHDPRGQWLYLALEERI